VRPADAHVAADAFNAARSAFATGASGSQIVDDDVRKGDRALAGPVVRTRIAKYSGLDMLNRRLVLAAVACTVALSLSPAFAMEPQNYDAKTVAAAQAAGKSVLLHITAPWCPTCKAQKPILSKLEAAPKFKELAVFNIDFDTSKDLLRKLKVAQQSTLIVYKGAKEVGRSTGDTSAASIEALLSKAL